MHLDAYSSPLNSWMNLKVDTNMKGAMIYFMVWSSTNIPIKQTHTDDISWCICEERNLQKPLRLQIIKSALRKWLKLKYPTLGRLGKSAAVSPQWSLEALNATLSNKSWMTHCTILHRGYIQSLGSGNAANCQKRSDKKDALRKWLEQIKRYTDIKRIPRHWHKGMAFVQRILKHYLMAWILLSKLNEYCFVVIDTEARIFITRRGGCRGGGEGTRNIW